jgi:hypothetical protein
MGLYGRPEGSAAGLDGIREGCGLGFDQLAGSEVVPYGTRQSIKRRKRGAADRLDLFNGHSSPFRVRRPAGRAQRMWTKLRHQRKRPFSA